MYANIENVTIPDSVIKIGRNSFAHCNFNEVIIGNNVSVIDEYAFWNCMSLTSVTVPNSVKSVGKAAFAACYKLQEFKGNYAEDNGRIFVIDGVLTAFAPYGLTEYTIPDSVTSIGNHAFYYCDSLTSVTIPESVTTIGSYAFYHCDSLTSVYCKATTPPALEGTSVFDSNGSDRKIYVPTESVEAYKSATNWSEYASAIVGYDF